MIIRLGDKVLDPLTGFSGIVTSRTEYLFGCVRVAVEASEIKDGKPVDAYFDEQRLTVLPESAAETQRRAVWDKNRGIVPTQHPGGPGDTPPVRSMPPDRRPA
jgi:hypothetical protein